jgi:hypothetical protein
MRLLAAGDMFGRLRERVRTGRPVIAGFLREWGLHPAAMSVPFLVHAAARTVVVGGIPDVAAGHRLVTVLGYSGWCFASVRII